MKFATAIEAGTKDTAFGVVVPDLPGCFSAGDTVEEAFDKAREAIDTHCEMLAEDEADLPTPRPLSDWQADPRPTASTGRGRGSDIALVRSGKGHA